MATKPRVRVPAGNSKTTFDNYQNFAAALGYGANNVSTGSTYGFNPISRIHTQLEWMYRGSWIVRQIIDAPSDDMTREGIEIESELPPDEIDKFHQYLSQKLIWQRLNSTIKWSRLYGGCIAVIMIDGQKPDTPLNLDTIGKNQFQGLLVLDRWQIQPHLELPVDDIADPDYGYPQFYDKTTDTTSRGLRIHHSRCLRLDGVELPYWQRIAENMWGLSVLEPLFDRLIAFDSTTTGVAQLVYKAHLRTMKIEKFRELLAAGGIGKDAIIEHLKMTRLMQANEGITVIDAADDFQVDSYSFAGLSDVLNQLSQQLSGAAQIPLTRLFGQSPAGLNATGESDTRNYYDAIHAQQEARLRPFITKVLNVAYRSLKGIELPDGFHFNFIPLWQMDAEQKSTVASTLTQTVCKAFEDAIIDQPTALKELRQMGRETGIWTNITDELIQEAEANPPPVPGAEQGSEGVPGALGQSPQGNQPAAQRGSDGPSEGKEKDTSRGPTLPPTTREHVSKMYSLDASQMANVVLGPVNDSEVIWIVEEQNPATKQFNNFRYLLQFADRDSAVAAYKAADPKPHAGIRRTNLRGMREYVSSSHYLNGHGHDVHAE